MAALFKSISATLLLLLLLPFTALADGDSCADDDTCRDRVQALKLKLGAIASILVAGAAGICIPIVGKSIPALRPDSGLFFAVKAFAAGVILATGFIHVLPDAFENLTSSCLSESPWQDFPFAGFVAMVAALGTLMVDSAATGFYKKMELNRAKPVGDNSDMEVGPNQIVPPQLLKTIADTHAHGHSHGTGIVAAVDPESELIRHRVISQVLELGIITHSVIIGVSLGASESPCTIKPLLAALSFHQFFEGMGLGSCLVQAQFKKASTILMAIFFSFTTPIGIIIGLLVSSSYNENSPNALIIEGVFNAASAGILIYMALVDLLAADFMNPKLQSNRKLQIVANISLLLGAGFMSLLAKWA